MVGLKVKTRFIFVALWTFVSFNLWAIDTSAPLQALRSKEYEKSLNLYREIEKQGYQSADMYQNMAVAALSLGKDVDAIIYAEKALKFRPENSDLKRLFASILKKNSKIESEDAKPAIALYFNQFVGVLGISIWIILSLLCLLALGWILFSGYPDHIMTRNNKAKLGLSLALFIIFTLLASYRNYQINNQNTIIITSDQTILKVSPDAESPDLSPLVAGSKVYYVDQINDWWHVTTVYGDDGWIKSTNGQRL